MSAPMDSPYWFYSKCPLSDECTVKLWKQWRVWGFTELDATQQLYNHLTESGKHLCSAEEADEHIAGCGDLLEWHPGTKSPASKAAPASKTSSASGSAALAPDVNRLLAITAGAAAEAGRLPLERRVAIGAPSSRPPVHAWKKQKVSDEVGHIMPPQIAPTVTLRMQEFNTIIDSVQRSSQAAKSAARIAAVASAAFTTESTTLDEIATTMMAMKAAAEFNSGAE
jgi:hypothetical protein